MDDSDLLCSRLNNHMRSRDIDSESGCIRDSWHACSMNRNGPPGVKQRDLLIVDTFVKRSQVSCHLSLESIRS